MSRFSSQYCVVCFLCFHAVFVWDESNKSKRPNEERLKKRRVPSERGRGGARYVTHGASVEEVSSTMRIFNSPQKQKAASEKSRPRTLPRLVVHLSRQCRLPDLVNTPASL